MTTGTSYYVLYRLHIACLVFFPLGHLLSPFPYVVACHLQVFCFFSDRLNLLFWQWLSAAWPIIWSLLPLISDSYTRCYLNRKCNLSEENEPVGDNDTKYVKPESPMGMWFHLSRWYPFDRWDCGKSLSCITSLFWRRGSPKLTRSGSRVYKLLRVWADILPWKASTCMIEIFHSLTGQGDNSTYGILRRSLGEVISQ